MSDHARDAYDDVLPEEPTGELVHWMEPRPITFGAAGISAAAAGAFALGAMSTLAVLAVLHWLGPEREVPRVRRRLKLSRLSDV